jgi:hypothetical protein
MTINKTPKAEQHRATREGLEAKDIEHGREACEDFLAYHLLTFLSDCFPTDRYTNHTIEVRSESLMTLFSVLANTLREDVRGQFGRH